VMTNSPKTEEVTAGGATAGIPGTASNLPRPAVRAGGPTNSTSRRTENISYESSHVVRKTRIPEGQIKRLSVSVLLDQKARWEGKPNARKQVLIPPSAETLKTVHDLVAGVTGFTQDRGDQITVESLPFAATLEEGAPELGIPTSTHPLTWKDYLHDKKILIGAGVGALLLVMLLGAAVMLLKKKKPLPVPTAKPVPVSAAVEEGRRTALAAANAAEQMEAALAERISEQQKADMASLAALKLPTITTKKQELLSKEIRESTKKDPQVSANVLATWLREE
jgi:flagellar M-ring protein FliF